MPRGAAKARQTISNYVEKIDVENLEISKFGEAMDIYDTAEEKWDDKGVELERGLFVIDEQIREEQDSVDAEIARKNKLRYQVVVNIFAEADNAIELDVAYSEGFMLLLL